jgi:hypothetical protein
MPRHTGIDALKEQQRSLEKLIEDAKEKLHAAKEQEKAELERQKRQLALKIGYLAIICGLGPVPDGDLESFFKTYVEKDV